VAQGAADVGEGGAEGGAGPSSTRMALGSLALAGSRARCTAVPAARSHGATAACVAATYGDEKVANREIRGFGTARQKRVLE
jgi:hypothetical protein